MRFEVPIPLGLTIIAVGIFVFWLIYKSKAQRINQMPDIPLTLPETGFEVPILATFTGLKRMPRQVSFAHNSLNPSLTLFEDRLECRVVLQKAIPLAEIENIDIWDTVATRNLHVYVKGREDLFTANLLNRRNLAQLLSFLQQRGIPLSNRAKAYLSANTI
jgi:hypothetical protein